MTDHPLASYRRAHGLTQADLARALDVHEFTVSRWETRARTPRKDDIEKLAKMTGISAAALLGISDEKVGAG